VTASPALTSFVGMERWNGQLPATMLGGATPVLPMLHLGSPRR
jgi:hypothetical protein